MIIIDNGSHKEIWLAHDYNRREDMLRSVCSDFKDKNIPLAVYKSGKTGIYDNNIGLLLKNRYT